MEKVPRMYDSSNRPEPDSDTESDTESEEDSGIESDTNWDEINDLEKEILILEHKLEDAKHNKDSALYENSMVEQMASETLNGMQQPGADLKKIRKSYRAILNELKQAKGELAVLTKRVNFYARALERRRATLIKNKWEKATASRTEARRAIARRVFGDMDSAAARERSAREQLAGEMTRDRVNLIQQFDQERLREARNLIKQFDQERIREAKMEDASAGESKSSEGLPFRGNPPAFTKPVPGRQEDGYFMGETFWTGENDRCAICWLFFDDTTNGQPVQLNCGHFFHKKCIQRHQSSKFGKINGVPTSWSKECPICRKPFTGAYSDGVNRLQNLRF